MSSLEEEGTWKGDNCHLQIWIAGGRSILLTEWSQSASSDKEELSVVIA